MADGVDRRNVLLLAHTVLSLRYVREHYDLLASDPRLRFAVARAPDRMSDGVEDGIEQLIKDSRQDPNKAEIARVRFEGAGEVPWDLALFGTHGSRELLGPQVPCVHIQHGLGAGKVAEDDDFTYGPQWVRYPSNTPRAGEPLYDVMLESSYSIRDQAVRNYPPLADRIRVVGDLSVDRLLLADAQRDEYRAALGIAPDQTALLLMSTWGPDGLMGPRGEKGIPLLQRATELGDEYRILLSMHPHLWHGVNQRVSSFWRPRLAQFRDRNVQVCSPEEDWSPYLAAADVGIIDHGSLGLYYGLLRRPSIAVPVPERAINPHAPIAELRAASPLLRDPDRLDATLASTLRSFDPDLAPPRERITAHPGQAAELVLQELYPLMRLPMPSPLPALTRAPLPRPYPLNVPRKGQSPKERKPSRPASRGADPVSPRTPTGRDTPRVRRRPSPPR
ncbi:MAG TPA: CDP-glycerol glycerophosphotransferase family protein [Mycobacteriales bacterium]|jgi:hypothetical protein|nr:CDP-glycerol glycerophosphotransferase family protein [Mycobacteriales bacterium]